MKRKASAACRADKLFEPLLAFAHATFRVRAFNLAAISSRGRGEFWLAVLIAAARRHAEGRLATACTA